MAGDIGGIPGVQPQQQIHRCALLAPCIFGWASPAGADNCGSPSDCFGVADAATTALLGTVLITALSIAIDLSPLGRARGIAEGLIGRDILTWQPLSPTQRVVGLIPGGRSARAVKAVDTAGTLRRTVAAVPTPRPTRAAVVAGAGTGGARGANVLGTGTGEGVRAGAAPPRARPGGAGPDDVLVRRGTDWESASRLDRQAKAAQEQGFGHGVSVTTPESNARLSRDPSDASSATRRAFEEADFPVHHTPTRTDPNHHTVELPDPVTPEAAQRFNDVLGRMRR